MSCVALIARAAGAGILRNSGSLAVANETLEAEPQ